MTALPSPSPRLTLGPVLYNWSEQRLGDFYARIADEADIDTVCIGETVCSKRQPLTAAALTRAVERLTRAGKEVVLSSLALIMTEREVGQARQLAAQADSLLVEANDFGVAALLEGRPFTVGPMVNVYNEGTLACLAAMGACRVCLPAELAAPAIATLAQVGPEIEVQAFGRLPLAISARCYHARSRGLAKDGCGYVCAEDCDGMEVDTLDDQPFLAVNGTQTLSGRLACLLSELGALGQAGISRFRLWPQAIDMVAVADLFRATAAGALAPDEAMERLSALAPWADFANGYVHGLAGHDLTRNALSLA